VVVDPAKALAPAYRALPAGTVLSTATFSAPETTATSAATP
jgi:hypothetical protein